MLAGLNSQIGNLRIINFTMVIFLRKADSSSPILCLILSPDFLRTFVANRIRRIREHTQILQWTHTDSQSDQAGLLLRGQTIGEFLDTQLWRVRPRGLERIQSSGFVLEIAVDEIVWAEFSDFKFAPAGKAVKSCLIIEKMDEMNIVSLDKRKTEKSTALNPFFGETVNLYDAYCFGSTDLPVDRQHPIPSPESYFADSVDYLEGILPELRNTSAIFFNAENYCDGLNFVGEKELGDRDCIEKYAIESVQPEFVRDLIAAVLVYFIVRYGKFADIDSYDGKNLAVANDILQNSRMLFDFCASWEETGRNLSNRDNDCGLERVIGRIFGLYLHSIDRDTSFIFGNFDSVVDKVNAIFHSHPLLPTSVDFDYPVFINPILSLIYDTFENLTEPIYQIICYRLSIWLHLLKLKQDGWSRWHEMSTTEDARSRPGVGGIIDINLPVGISRCKSEPCIRQIIEEPIEDNQSVKKNTYERLLIFINVSILM